MATYIGTKKVIAEPMTYGEYCAYRGWTITDGKNPEDKGYLVEYEPEGKPNVEGRLGYVSWTPAAPFEKAYRIADTFKDRLAIEMEEVAIRHKGLSKFIESDAFSSLNNYQKTALLEQEPAMREYIECLYLRVKGINESIENADVYLKLKAERLDHGDIGDAKRWLDAGLLVQREGWNGKGMFIVKQIPASINSKIIPIMQSLPESAKRELLSREVPVIKYTNQMLIVNRDGRADSWVPSSSDFFATDWKVYIPANYEVSE